MEQEREKVFLYLYDLSQGMARRISSAFSGNTIEGVWHSGVGVFGKEYFYGAGIQCVPIGQSPFGFPVEVIELGDSHIPKDIFEEFLHEIGPRYTMAAYSFLNHNCNYFTDEAAQFLVGSGIPHHILRQADIALNNPLGALMLPMLQQMETTLQNGGILVAPTNTPPSSTSTMSMARESTSSFSAPSPTPLQALFPSMACGIPPVDCIASIEPTPPRRNDQSRIDNEEDMDIEKNEEK